MRKLVLLAGVVLALAACSPDTQTIDGSWVLVSGSSAGEEVPILADHPITLAIDSDHISGIAACNTYGGEMNASSGSMQVSELFQTEMGCIPQEVMDAESIYLGALGMVDVYALDDERLVFTGPDTELIFESAGDSASIAPTDRSNVSLWSEEMYGAWQLNSGVVDGMPVLLLDTHPITLTIDEDGVGGTAACNHYGLDPTGGFSVTEMACFPTEVMELESTYLAALDRVEEGVVEDGLLLVARGETGSEVELQFVALDPVPTADLLGTVWVLDSLVNGETVSSVSGERATLELFSDGSFIGSTGCRTISGSYVVTGAEVQFTEFGASGDCPDDLADQDSQVISVLEGGFRVEIDGDQMLVGTQELEALIYRADP